MAELLTEMVVEEKIAPNELSHAIPFTVADVGDEQTIHEIEVENLNEGDVSMDAPSNDIEILTTLLSINNTTTDDPSEHAMTNTMEEMNELLDEYYTRTSNRFAIVNYKGMKDSLDEIDFSHHKIFWEDLSASNSSLVYDGVPFIIYGRIILCCQFGSDQNLSSKRKNAAKRKESENTGEKRTGRKKRGTKKCGCPAQIVVRRIIKFPGFKLQKEQDTVRRRKTFSKTLKEKLKENSKDVEMRNLFLGILPPVSRHCFHENIKCTVEPIDKEIILKIQELTLKNIPTHDVMKEIEIMVCDELFYMKLPPDRTRRRYFPSIRDVRNIMRNTKEAAKILQSHIRELKDYFQTLLQKQGTVLYFNFDGDGLLLEQSADQKTDNDLKEGKTKPDNIQEFVLFHQSPQQQYLLNRYGSIVFITEVQPTETGTRALTVRLFLMLVRTNVDYQVVGTILMDRFNGNGLHEGLVKCREKNEAWMPRYFMVDLNEELLLSVRDLFPESDYFVTKSSCNEIWRKFLSKPSNGVSQEASQILNYLNAMRVSATKDELTYAASALEQSEIWTQCENLRNWFQGSWLPIAEKWVREYLPDDLRCYVQDTSGDNVMKIYQDMLMRTTQRNKEGCIVDLVKKLTSELLDTHFESYVTLNREHYHHCKQLKQLNPAWEFEFALPLSLYRHLVPVIESLDEVVSVANQTSYGNYEVSVNSCAENGETLNEFFAVDLGNSLKLPSCTCAKWRMNCLPCSHMLTVFKNFPLTKYDALSPLYRSSPIFGFDYSCFGNEFYVKPVSVSTQTTSTIGTQVSNKVQVRPAKIPMSTTVKNSKEKVKRVVKTDKVVKIVEQIPTHSPQKRKTFLVASEIPLVKVKVKSIKDILTGIPKETIEQFKQSLRNRSTKDNQDEVRNEESLVDQSNELPESSTTDEIQCAVNKNTILQIEELILPREETISGEESSNENNDETQTMKEPQLKLMMKLLEDHQSISEPIAEDSDIDTGVEDHAELSIATKRKCNDLCGDDKSDASLTSKKMKGN
ncbi:uncharacterized protein [Clytia hemisphaerica]|uniref:SWIM-type domain-containing protein n=1 Tax=Clytia hemisphaerica TaxID=252671 RepID=A0A7M5TWV3_9CNID